MSDTEELTCQLDGCGKTEAQHKMMAHQFQASGGALKKPPAPNKVVIATVIDPALRVLLVQKGVISWEELTSVEEGLKGSGLLGPSSISERPGSRENLPDRPAKKAERSMRSHSTPQQGRRVKK